MPERSTHVVPTTTAGAVVVVQPHSDSSGATSDAHLINLWLAGRSRHTQRAYAADAELFLDMVAKPLRAVTVADVVAFTNDIQGANATRARKVAALKSLLSFGHRVGYLPFNVGSVVQVPPAKNELAARILPEPQVQRMLALETNPRNQSNQSLLRILYGAGLRVSEACALQWNDLQPRDNAGQACVHGKGEKTRYILLSRDTWATVQAQRPADAASTAPVFRSRQGGHLDPSSVHRIVRNAAKRAGVDLNVSPHWLRHAHASHALDRGAPIHLVQATLGHASVATTGRYLHAKPTESSALYVSA